MLLYHDPVIKCKPETQAETCTHWSEEHTTLGKEQGMCPISVIAIIVIIITVISVANANYILVNYSFSPEE